MYVVYVYVFVYVLMRKRTFHWLGDFKLSSFDCFTSRTCTFYQWIERDTIRLSQVNTYVYRKKKNKGLRGKSKDTVKSTDKLINKLLKYYGLAHAGLCLSGMLMKCSKKFGLHFSIYFQLIRSQTMITVHKARIAGAHIAARRHKAWT